eukprot:3690079-Amphidinium_carterae.1
MRLLWSRNQVLPAVRTPVNGKLSDGPLLTGPKARKSLEAPRREPVPWTEPELQHDFGKAACYDNDFKHTQPYWKLGTAHRGLMACAECGAYDRPKLLGSACSGRAAANGRKGLRQQIRRSAKGMHPSGTQWKITLREA